MESTERIQPARRNWGLAFSILLLISAIVMLFVHRSLVSWLNLAVSISLVIAFGSIRSSSAESSRKVD